jgi:NADPH:quinone reductase-like Zn-dependent oxidoreductase
MRAVVITKHGDFGVLRVQERPEPEIAPGKVRVAVGAAGENFADTMARVGLYADAPKPPCVVGYEVAGTIVEVGEGVESVSAGDRVLAGTQFGGYAEQVVVGERDVVALPEGMTFEEGAAIPVNYSTAWAGLFDYGALRAGQRVLVHAAAGGVGIAVTQLAKHAGAEVHGTASPGKHDAIRGVGVDRAIDYTRPGWEKGLGSYDVIMDAIGGDSFKRSYDLLAPGGRLIAFGASSVMSGERRNVLKAAPKALRMLRGFNLIDQMQESKTVVGLNMLTLWKARGTLEPWIAPLRERMADGTIAPVIAEAVPFDRAGDAHRLIAERRNVGKVVLVP